MPSAGWRNREILDCASSPKTYPQTVRLPKTSRKCPSKLGITADSLRKNQPGNGKLRAQFPSPINQSTGGPRGAIAAGASFGHYCILVPLGNEDGQATLATNRIALS